jgi:GNAT superfamily N-acetyltransferase
MVHVGPVHSDLQIAQTQMLFREYGSAPEVALCVVNFEQEILTLPGDYAPPAGRLLLATHQRDDKAEGTAAGCVALREWDSLTRTCELKRLFVCNKFRGQGVGAELLRAAMREAQLIGYRRIVLDTLPTMIKSHALYRSFGFHEIAAYRKNPITGALFFEMTLS